MKSWFVFWSVYVMTRLLPWRLTQNNLKDEGGKDRNVFSPAIKEINLLIDMIWVLVTWHLDCCPFRPKFCDQGQTQAKQNQWYKSTVCAVISASVLTVYMSTAMPRGYVSPSRAAPMKPNTPQLLWRWWRLHVCSSPTGP